MNTAPHPGRADALPEYAELHCLSNFSFLRGASHPRELVERAKELGYSALAITDECSMAGVVRGHEAAKRTGLKLIIGTEVTLADGLRLVLLAEDHDGYTAICGLITTARRAAAKGKYFLTQASFNRDLPGVLALWVPGNPVAPAQAGAQCPVSPGKKLDSRLRGNDDEHGAWLAATFPGRAWIAFERHLAPDDGDRLAALRELGARHRLPLVAAGDVHMHARGRRGLQDVLTAVRLGRPVAGCGHALFPNGERHLRRREALARLYPPDLLAESVAIAERCTFSLDALRYEYPHELVPAGETATSWLRRLTGQGARRRWPAGTPAPVQALIDKELALVAELGYEHFFLTVHDVVAFARGRGILCQGRGSAANSAVCYALGITEVDPARMNVLFERFLSRERNEPPDIDVDFEHQRREEVIQYVYDKYGRERAALAATVITWKARSAVRDAGKALGLSPDQVDRLAKSLAWWDDAGAFAQRIRECGLDPESSRARQLFACVHALQGFPRHLSQHVGGFVMSDTPLSTLVPVENAAMDDRTIIQWDKDDLESLGLLKVDCLALGMLSAIRRALAFVSARRGAPFTMADVPAEDPATYDMIGRAETTGVFQIESRAQMTMLPRLKPRSFYDLVIEVAIIRPGPILGKMVHPYLRRRQGLEQPDYPKPLERVLGRTLGIPIFQEQVMEIAMVAAGFSAGEADQVRRSMAAWRRHGGLEHFRGKLLGGMRERGYDPAFAENIYQMVLGFGSYGFPESHAASFALLGYVSSWLKCHQPAAFFAALINSQPMGFYPVSMLVREARRMGVEVRPVCITASDWDCTLESTSRPAAQPGAGLARCSQSSWTDVSTPVAPLRVRPAAGCSQRPGSGFKPGGTREMARELVVNGLPVTEKGHATVPEASPLPQPPPTRGGGKAGALPPCGGGSGWGDQAAIRLGLRLVNGLREDRAGRIVAARTRAPFASVDDLVHRAELDARDRRVLADADALRALAGHRHDARWTALGAQPLPGLLAGHAVAEPPPELSAPREGADIVDDYASTGLTLRRHPVALLRDRLRRLRAHTATDLARLESGRQVTVAGLVMFRQRPQTASGVVFVSLEDETGTANLIVWPKVVEAQRRAVLGARLMVVTGELQCEQGVVHVIAKKIRDRSDWLGELPALSRDFH